MFYFAILRFDDELSGIMKLSFMFQGSESAGLKFQFLNLKYKYSYHFSPVICSTADLTHLE